MDNVNQASAVVRKRKAAWDGIRLEHCQLQPGELPRHRHREHVVLLSLTNGCKGELITASGVGVRGTQTKGNVCVLPAGLDHEAALEGNSENLALYLDPSLITKAAAEAQLSGSVEIAERYTRRDNVINSVGMAFLGELETEGLSGRLYAESLGNVLAVHLAQVAGMSSFHFAREFKRTTGTTPHQYLIKFRIERAKALLARNDLPLTEVGLRSGFSHQSHFTRLFRRITGTTPNSYRLTLQT
jgi:AraC family transcriptional regulator